jgi:hypothetical protein
MHRTLPSARTAAALALTLGVALVLPGAAFAGTTEPTPVTTTSTSTGTGTGTTGEPTGSTTTTATTSTTTSSGPTTTTPGTGTTTTDSSTPSPSPTTAAPSAPSTTAAPKPKPATPLKQIPFGAHSGLRASLLPGDSSNRAGYAAGFMVRTLAARGDHYNYPASTFFDGGNTIDAILGLDGAKGGLDEADAAFGYLDQNLGNYNGGDPQFGLYAGPTAKALLAVVAHGGDPSDFGGQDLLDLMDQSLGAVEPGRYSDLPVDCGFSQCDFSNTIGQSLAIIAVGRATGDVAQEAADFLLDQQCPDGGFRGDLDAAGCTSDLDATAFAVQAVIGLLGADDQAATDALDFLASRQAANGGFLNQDGQYNANTAGVAAQAFAAGGRSTQLIAAQGFLATLQLDCDFAAALRGGIAFTSADRTILGGTPDTDAERKAFADATDRALRATPQATLGLAGGTLLTVTSDGAAAAAPAAPTCVAPTTTTTTTVPSTTTTTTPAAVADPASATPGALAFTGSNVAALTLLGLMLLLVGAAAIVVARRKGVHA